MLSSDAALAKSFHSLYEPCEVLGRGLCSVVRRCVEKSTKKEFAVKIIDITRKENGETCQAKIAARNEIELLQVFGNHRNIIKLHDAFETSAFIFLVFEICANGELFDYLTERIQLSEKRTRAIMKQLFEALALLHSKSVVHRDVKCENILLDQSLNIRLSDFGFAAKLDDGIKSKELLGTPGYLSPEMLQASMSDSHSGYGVEVDIWSCGVVMYTLLAGSPPFWHRKQLKMLRNIMEGIYNFNGPEWDDCSEESKDLIRSMLTIDPSRRITAEEALQHKFFSQNDSPTAVSPFTRMKGAIIAVMFVKHLEQLVMSSSIALEMISTNPYSSKLLRKSIDTAAFKVYGHWVKKGDEQNRGALFEKRSKQ